MLSYNSTKVKSRTSTLVLTNVYTNIESKKKKDHRSTFMFTFLTYVFSIIDFHPKWVQFLYLIASISLSQSSSIGRTSISAIILRSRKKSIWLAYYFEKCYHSSNFRQVK